jgi:hypothetical protein
MTRAAGACQAIPCRCSTRSARRCPGDSRFGDEAATGWLGSSCSSQRPRCTRPASDERLRRRANRDAVIPRNFVASYRPRAWKGVMTRRVLTATQTATSCPPWACAWSSGLPPYGLGCSAMVRRDEPPAATGIRNSRARRRQCGLGARRRRRGATRSQRPRAQGRGLGETRVGRRRLRAPRVGHLNRAVHSQEPQGGPGGRRLQLRRRARPGVPLGDRCARTREVRLELPARPTPTNRWSASVAR